MKVSCVKILRALALCAAFALSDVQQARALELNDLIIEFDTISTYEVVEPARDVYRSQSQWPRRLDAIAGSLVWQSGSGLCMDKSLSLVYKRGAHQGSIDCPVEREGTSTTWYERGAKATFETTLAIAGTTLTLQGKMTGSGVRRDSWCGDVSATDIETVHTQRLKIKISANKCEVLEYQEIHTEGEVYTEGSRLGDEKSTTSLYQLAPGATCVIKRRSQQPISEPGALASAVGRCSGK